MFGWAVATRRPARSASRGAGCPRDGGGEAALAVAERAQARQLGAGLGEEVVAGDPEIGDAVADELDDVVRPDEEDVEVEVPDPRDEAPLVLLEDEAGVVEQLDRRFDEAALVRDGEPQPVRLGPLERVHRSRPAG